MPTGTVEQARRALGPVGASLPNIPFGPPVPFAEQRAAARRLEDAGWPALWANEGVGGKDLFVQLALLLEATERITFATGLANVWARPPETAHGALTMLADAHPERIVAGFGIGYPEQAAAVGRTFDRPLATMRAYLERMGHQQAMSPAPDVAYPRIVAASGPRMVALGAETTDGVLTVLVPPWHTEQVRRELGPERLLVVGLTVAVDDDPARARRAAEEFTRVAVTRAGSPYAANLLRIGYSPADLDGSADRVVDEVLAHGRPEDIAAAVRRHLDAGADHVRISAITPDFADGVAQALRLAPTLTGHR